MKKKGRTRPEQAVGGHDCALSRRSFLRGAAAAAAFSAIPVSRLVAAAPTEHRFIALYFSSAWDVLLGLDPRDPSRRYPGIDLGTEDLPAEFREPTAVRIGGRQTLLGPAAVPLIPHLDKATIVRGINMNTVAHNMGRAYMQTYRMPAGASPRGDSLSAVYAARGALGAEGPPLPNVAIGIESYNVTMPTEASAVRLNRPADVPHILGAPASSMPTAIERLLEEAEEMTESCIDGTYRGPSPSDQYELSKERLERLRATDAAGAFDLGSDADVASLYGLTRTSSDATPAYRAATAAQLIKLQLARSVSVVLTPSLDTHFSNWRTIQGPRQLDGFTAVAALLTDLRRDDPELDRTTVVAFSEFSRTPKINGSGGRDHWFANSIAIFGNKLQPGVLGATNEDDLGLLEIDLATGQEARDGTMLSPEHVAATLVASIGLDSAPYRLPGIMEWVK